MVDSPVIPSPLPSSSSAPEQAPAQGAGAAQLPAQTQPSEPPSVAAPPDKTGFIPSPDKVLVTSGGEVIGPVMVPPSSSSSPNPDPLPSSSSAHAEETPFLPIGGTLDQAIADAAAGKGVDMEIALTQPPPSPSPKAATAESTTPVSLSPALPVSPSSPKRYRCHKEVSAFQIAAIDRQFVKPLLTPTDPAIEPVHVPPGWLERHNPKVGGYVVIYDDGYTSFSPQYAFESGYTLIGSEPAPVAQANDGYLPSRFQIGDAVIVAEEGKPSWHGTVYGVAFEPGKVRYGVATGAGDPQGGSIFSIESDFVQPVTAEI